MSGAHARDIFDWTWHTMLRTLAYCGVAAYPLWRIWPFALAAWIGWDANP